MGVLDEMTKVAYAYSLGALIESLSRIDGLRVPTRRSTTRLKQQGETIQAIGDSLAVGGVVTGSIQRSADKLLSLER